MHANSMKPNPNKTNTISQCVILPKHLPNHKIWLSEVINYFISSPYPLKYIHVQHITGHNLIWGVGNPSWLTQGNFTADQLKQIMKNHITTVMTHYKDKQFNGSSGVYSWDVVNEAVNDVYNLYNYNVWYPKIKDYVNLAFTYAGQVREELGLNVKLFYNDNHNIMDGGFQKNKSDAIFQVVQNITNHSIPIDGVGFENHLDVGNDYEAITTYGYDAIVTNFKRYADLGLDVHITEMDVSCGKGNVPCTNYSQEIQQMQSEMYAVVLKACLDSPNCKNFETWGYTDLYTWKGTNQYPLPFDTEYRPKMIANYIENTLLNTTDFNLSTIPSVVKNEFV